MGFRINSSKFEDLPDSVRRILGEKDKTKYTEEYLGKNIGGMIGLQVVDGKSDFYVIEKQKYERDYQHVGVDQISAETTSYLKNAGIADVLGGSNPNIFALKKMGIVEMILMSELGYPIDQAVVIETPWGDTQTKPAGQDAYLTYDAGNKKYYMVNATAKGLPAAYSYAP